VIEGDGRHEVMTDVCANDVMEEMGVDEAEIAVDGRASSTGEVPGLFGRSGAWRHRCVGGR